MKLFEITERRELTAPSAAFTTVQPGSFIPKSHMDSFSIETNTARFVAPDLRPGGYSLMRSVVNN